MSGFISGLLHPLAVPAHVLALLAAGLLIGQRGAGGTIVPLAAFAAGAAAGLTAVAFALRQSLAADVLLVAAAAAGALVALAQPLPAFVCAALAGLTGAALALDSPPQAVSIAVATASLIGSGLGACLALAAVAAAARRLTQPWQKVGLRILGSWIAAIAILVLALRFARGQLF